MISSYSVQSRAGGSRVRLGKGEVVYMQGDPASAFYTVEQGVVRTCHYQADGYRQITGFHYPGDSFGLDISHYAESAEAVTDLTCARFARRGAAPDLANRQEPDLDPTDRRSLLHAARGSAQDAMFLLGRRTAAERVAAFLLTAAERCEDPRRVELMMSRTDIADYLGLTIHTISRTISQLCSEGLIVLDGPQHFSVLDWAKMRALAGLET